MRTKRTPHLAPLLLSLTGIAFSLWNALEGAEKFCVTDGCTLYQSFNLGGVSLWWVGVGSFVLFAILSLPGLAKTGRIITGLGLAADIVLLVIMFFTLPCLACLIEAALLALCHMAFRNTAAEPNGQTTFSSPLLLVWGLFFVLVAGSAVRGNGEPWPITQLEGEHSVHIFFSPSCNACRKLVSNLSESDSRDIAWYPVAENEQDIAVIHRLQTKLEEGGAFSLEFEAAQTAEPLSLKERLHPSLLLLQYRLWRNQAHVITSGDGRLPFLEFSGLPKALLRNHDRTTTGGNSTATATSTRAVYGTGKTGPASNAQDDFDLPIDLGNAGSCGGHTTTPCTE